MIKNLWNFSEIEQEHESSITSINAVTMPKTVKYVQEWITPGSVWADIGGGRFDNVAEFFKSKGAILHIYDPFNRSHEHNVKAVENIKNSQCDGVMVNNVLNVIDSKPERARVISQAFDAIKDGGLVFFKIYEGNKTAVKSVIEKPRGSSAQLNWRASQYLPEIQEVFGSNIHRVGDIIIARKVLEKNLDINSSVDDLMGKIKLLGIGKRNPALGVGKVMGDEIYMHKQYAQSLDPDIYNKALEVLKQNTVNFEFDIIKFNKKTSRISFISSPDFNVSDEPVVGDIVSVDVGDGAVSFTKKKKDPQIYHHKWMFVKDDYAGFDVKQSMLRSIQWKSIVGQNKDISSRIGYQSFWQDLQSKGFKTESVKIKTSK